VNNLRVFFIGGYLAYRALFNWIHWSIYVPTMLGSPIFQILFFAYVGRFAGLQNDAFSSSATPFRSHAWPASTGWR
jgi:ABC-2 type transport system permease protein